MKNYEIPSIEIVEIEVEGAVMSTSNSNVSDYQSNSVGSYNQLN